ncbi:MAG: cell division protein FtsW [Oscillospiraceae bacterium]|nr:cell division protein FtsW [Oscillospiraceae bacterium]
MLTVTLILVVVGLVMMWSASYANALYYKNDGFYYIKKQALFAAAGVFCMMAISYVPYRILHRFAWLGYFVSVVMLFFTLFMPEINGSKRWLVFGSFTFQPSELAKFTIILLFAHLISQRPNSMGDFKLGFARFMVLLAGVIGIMMLQTHVSGSILICLFAFAVMFAGGAKVKHFLATAAVVVPAGLLALFTLPPLAYAKQRVVSMFSGGDTSKDLYQITQSLIAIGSGGLFGLGLGNSRQKQLYVPEPQNDFVFSIVVEELGFAGALVIIALFMYFVFRGFKISLGARDKFGALLAVGVTSQIGVQTVLNIAVVTATIPNTGISLPFFSQGGTALFLLLCEVGVVLSVARYSRTNES